MVPGTVLLNAAKLYRRAGYINVPTSHEVDSAGCIGREEGVGTVPNKDKSIFFTSCTCEKIGNLGVE